jgi:hypothetical protein
MLIFFQLSEPVPDDIDAIAPIEYAQSSVEVGAECTIYGWGTPGSVREFFGDF